MSLIDQITSKLPISIGKKQPSDAQYYFALDIGLSKVTAALWSVLGNHLEIISHATSNYSDTEDLFEKANHTLDKALGAFDIEPEKVLFGVPEGWLMDDDLKEPYLKLLRRMVKEYGLEPMAYVSSAHAISHYVHKQEGAPISAVLVGIDDFVVTTVVQGGKIVGSKAVKRTHQIFEDISKALLQFHDIEVLPSKILLYSDETDKLDKIRDSLLSFPWMQKLPFLHFPKIESLPEHITITSIIFAGASELYPDIQFKIDYASAPVHTKSSLKDVDHEVVLPAAAAGFVAGDIAEKGHHNKEDHAEIDESEELSEDYTEDEAIMEEEIKESEESDILDHETAMPSHAVEHSEVPLAPRHNPPAVVEDEQPDYRPVPAGRLAFLAPVLPVIDTVTSKVRGSLGVFLIPLLVLVALVGAYIFFLKAEVAIYVEPKILEKSTEVVADPNATKVDENAKIIPASVVQTTSTGTAKATASGKKEIGDPAKGSVIIYNATGQSLSLSSGTVLTSDNGLKFTLDTSAQVASKSASAADPPSHSNAINVTASAIGPDGNLSAGTDLKVGGYNKADVVAKIDTAFSGGTSKNVTVVTSDDQKKLQSQVTDDLRKKAAQEVQDKLKDGQKMATDALSIVDSKFTFSKAVNDQASEFSVNATINFKGTSYMDSDLKTIVGKLVETNVPDGFQLSLTDTETQAAVSKIEKDGKLIFLAKFKAKLMPVLDVEAIRKEIKGKKIEAVADDLQGKEHIIGSEIKLIPSLPAAIAYMPWLEKNIKITVGPK
jgi:hypothetical protein